MSQPVASVAVTGSLTPLADSRGHRRRIKTEEKAKVVASVGGGGGEEFIKFLVALAILPRGKSSYYSNRPVQNR